MRSPFMVVMLVATLVLAVLLAIVWLLPTETGQPADAAVMCNFYDDGMSVCSVYGLSDKLGVEVFEDGSFRITGCLSGQSCED